jgi:hypothetical protein
LGAGSTIGTSSATICSLGLEGELGDFFFFFFLPDFFGEGDFGTGSSNGAMVSGIVATGGATGGSAAASVGGGVVGSDATAAAVVVVAVGGLGAGRLGLTAPLTVRAACRKLPLLLDLSTPL